ncbi:MAG: hypothetical protein WCS55_08525 [Sulfuricurvum sp.]|uniref:hypothetical protein n=1 Tax=Sulfuricurvum sp. TaxID=2025608 RepID=UPI00356A08EB
MAYAPIALFTYNRLEELEYTVQALQHNLLAAESDLTVYSDAPKTEKEIEKVSRVRAFLKTLDGFKSITVVERNENFGLARSVIEGVSDILRLHDKVIVLEDDLLTSKNFLTYMNKALDFYQHEERIFSISGYTMPLKSLREYKNDTYLALRPASWGWATWKNQWENIDWELQDYDTFIQDKKAIKRFNRGGIDLTRMLTNYKNKKNNSWAIRWSYAMFKAQKYAVYPKLSKVQNIGFSDDATHCTNEHIYMTDLDSGEQFAFDFTSHIALDKKITEDFKSVYEFHNKLLRKMKIKLSNYLSTLQTFRSIP